MPSWSLDQSFSIKNRKRGFGDSSILGAEVQLTLLFMVMNFDSSLCGGELVSRYVIPG